MPRCARGRGLPGVARLANSRLAFCIFFGTLHFKWLRASSPSLSCFGDRLRAGNRFGEWLSASSREDKRTIGRDIAKVQYGWPVGLPLCRPLSAGLWEVRSSLPSKREVRIFFGFH